MEKCFLTYEYIVFPTLGGGCFSLSHCTARKLRSRESWTHAAGHTAVRPPDVSKSEDVRVSGPLLIMEGVPARLASSHLAHPAIRPPLPLLP